MTCDDARAQFSALIDERLSREDRADVYAHLATCAECRRELTALERTVALVRAAPPERAPASFVDRVMAATAPPWYVRAVRAALLPWPVKVPLEAAAILLVAGLAILMARGLGEQQRFSRVDAPTLEDRAASPERPTSGSQAEQQAEAKTDRSAAVAPAPPPAPPAATPAPAAPSSPAPPVAPAPAAAPPPATSRLDTPAAQAPAAARDAAAPVESRDKVVAARREMARETLSAAAAPPDVVGRLTTSDADTAATAVASVASRMAGAELGRRSVEGGVIIDLALPRERYADFAREVARLGDYRTESEPAALPDTIRIAVRLSR
jgi:hypothetical protein